MTKIRLEFRAGTHVEEAAHQMVSEANRTFSVVSADFNGFTLKAALPQF